MGVRLKEQAEVIEGEVVEIEIDKSVQSGAEVGKVVVKTTEMEGVYDLGKKMVETFKKEKIIAGDVITIEKSTGTVSKLGRSHSRSTEFDSKGS